MSTILILLGWLAGLVIAGVALVLINLFSLGLMHQHLRNRGESFGAPARADERQTLRH